MEDETCNDKRKQWNSEIDPGFAAEVEGWRQRKGLSKQQVTQASLMMFMTADAVARDEAGEQVIEWCESNAIRDGPVKKQTAGN